MWNGNGIPEGKIQRDLCFIESVCRKEANIIFLHNSLSSVCVCVCVCVRERESVCEEGMESAYGISKNHTHTLTSKNGHFQKTGRDYHFKIAFLFDNLAPHPNKNSKYIIQFP